MKKLRLVFFGVMVMFVSGCSFGWVGGQQPELVHVIGEDSVRTVHPGGIYDAPAFRASDNIHAESVTEADGHTVLLAQIKDREQFHVHDEHDLIVYLKEGEGKLKTSHRAVDVKSGDWTLIPRGVPHQFVTTSETPARAVVVRTPPAENDRRPVTPSDR